MVRTLCLSRALERHEPYGVWGGELLIDGVIVAEKRGRGRPPKVPRPRVVVDEITGIPIVA
jgi:WhiB family redox-sensing transcriptional regulator